MDRALLEQRLRELPIVQYEFFSTDQLVFSEKVRYICETECPQFGTTWACPPAVGSVESCRERCLRYPDALLLVTMTEVEDLSNMPALLATRATHEEITRTVHGLLREQGMEPYVLSTESCEICEHCAYPDAPCRRPEVMYPCVESQGILVSDLAERFGIDFMAAGNLVTWFSLLLYKE